MEGDEIYRKALESGRPIALVGLHAGLPEELHRIPRTPAGRPFLILTAPAFSPPLTAFMARGRERDNKHVLWIGTKGARGLEAGIRLATKSKGILALMVDQHPGMAGKCEYLKLWEKVKVPYPSRLLNLLSERNFLMLPVSTLLKNDGSTLFRFHSAWEKPSPHCIRTFLQNAISDAPDQWNWSYPKNDST